jgi:hypothetical protein
MLGNIYIYKYIRPHQQMLQRLIRSTVSTTLEACSLEGMGLYEGTFDGFGP